MKSQEANFATVTNKDGIVEQIGRSTVYHPKINYTGKGTKWFDDSTLIKKNQK